MTARSECIVAVNGWLPRIEDHTDAVVAADWFQDRSDGKDCWGDVSREWRWVGDKGKLTWHPVGNTTTPMKIAAQDVRAACKLAARRALGIISYGEALLELAMTADIRDVECDSRVHGYKTPCLCGNDFPRGLTPSVFDSPIKVVELRLITYGEGKEIWSGECKGCGRRYYGTKREHPLEVQFALARLHAERRVEDSEAS